MLARGTFTLVALILSLWPSSALANARHESPYSYEQTFGTAVRLLKVDLELEVTEVDSEWGILSFVYTSSESGKRKNRGSFTFVKDEDGVDVSLQIPQMPSYHEQIIIDKLKLKLTSEYGDPPPPRKKPKKDRKKDEDKDKDDKDKNKDGDKDKKDGDENQPKAPDDGSKKD